MITAIRRLVEHRAFQLLIIVVILVNAVLLGVETSATFRDNYGGLLHAINWLIQGIFVIELLLRLLACAPNFGRFFKDGWNVFDFLVVTISMLPVAGPFAGGRQADRLGKVR